MTTPDFKGYDYSILSDRFPDSVIEEFKASAIHPHLCLLNAEFLLGSKVTDVVLDSLADLGEAKSWCKSTYAKISQAGGTAYSGIDIENSCVSACNSFKPLEAPIGKDGKQKKYLNPPKTPSTAFYAIIDAEIWKLVAERQGIDIPDSVDVDRQWKREKIGSEDWKKYCVALSMEFWRWVIANPEIAITITEGGKKGLAGISTGEICIALSGIWNGAPGGTLLPSLKLLVTPDRFITIAFDRDTKRTAKDATYNATTKISKLLLAEKCKVYEAIWENEQGKGIDDLIFNCGVKVFHKAIDRATEIKPSSKTVDEKVESPKSKNTSSNPLVSDGIATDTGYPALAEVLGINLIFDKDGKIVSNLVRLTLDLFDLVGDRLKLNLMTRDYEYEGKPIDLDGIKSFIAHNLGYDSSTENCIQAMRSIANKFAYHPVREYLKALEGNVDPDFEVLDNIATIFLGNEDLLANRMMAKTLIGAVARVLNPGAKVDTLTVLQGEQGHLKSTFLRVLAGESWFCDDIRDLENKDELAKLARYWIIELAEVDYLMGRKEVESFKRFLSTTSDTYRPPYGRANIRNDRTCALFATTNKNDFLKDSTGSRRYWVVKVGSKIDCKLVESLRDVIWATALAAYQRGDVWWLNEIEDKGREESNEEYRDVDPWEEIILAKWKDIDVKEHKNRKGVTSDEVTISNILFILGVSDDKAGKRDSNRVGSILKGMGFKNEKVFASGQNRKAWIKTKASEPVFSGEPPEVTPLKDKVMQKYPYLGSVVKKKESISFGNEFQAILTEPNCEPNSWNDSGAKASNSAAGKGSTVNSTVNSSSPDNPKLGSLANQLVEPSPVELNSKNSSEPKLGSLANQLVEPSPVELNSKNSSEPKLGSLANQLVEPDSARLNSSTQLLAVSLEDNRENEKNKSKKISEVPADEF